MPDARFFHNKGPFTLAQVLAWSGATLSHPADPSSLVKDIATLDAAQPGQLSFFHNSRYRPCWRAAVPLPVDPRER